MIEFLLGNKQRGDAGAAPPPPGPPRAARGALRAPTLYDEAIRLLARRGFAIDPERLERDWRIAARRQPSRCRRVGRRSIATPREHWELYELAEELVDLEDCFRQWRFRHVTTVERIIGFKRGTGGTSGVGYLRHALDIRPSSRSCGTCGPRSSVRSVTGRRGRPW